MVYHRVHLSHPIGCRGMEVTFIQLKSFLCVMTFTTTVPYVTDPPKVIGESKFTCEWLYLFSIMLPFPQYLALLSDTVSNHLS